MINSETKVYGSFSSRAGNLGCTFHNRGFDVLGINAIYKSFTVKSIANAMTAVRELDFKGASISMPFKSEVLKYVDEIDNCASEIWAANTIINNDNILYATNTDWIACHQYLSRFKQTEVVILGNGGFSKAAQYACNKLNKSFRIIVRNNWDDIFKLENELVFNCTPVENLDKSIHESNKLIDCLNFTLTGKQLSIIQAKHQFKLYTGQDYPLEIWK